jgi:DNA polymerase-3 subunit delta'
MSSFLNSYKIGIIKHAENLSEQAANALLKTLEEPREKVVLILITSDLDQLPKTIVSRAKLLDFRPVKADIIYDFLVQEKKVSRSQAKNLSRLCLGRPALALKFFENQDFYDNYCRRAEAYLNFTGQDINERFAVIRDLLDEKSGNQENAKQALRIIEIWQGLVRDLLLINFGRDDLVQHHLFADRMARIKDHADLRQLINLKNFLQQAKENIAANVGAKLALENIATYF